MTEDSQKPETSCSIPVRLVEAAAILKISVGWVNSDQENRAREVLEWMKKLDKDETEII